MQTHQPSSGHSASVSGWLSIDGQRHQLAQVGPDFCILRNPVFFETDAALNGLVADLAIEVDGEQTEVDVKLLSVDPSSSKRIDFLRL